MAADDLATQVARSSATTVLTMHFNQALIFQEEGFKKWHNMQIYFYVSQNRSSVARVNDHMAGVKSVTLDDPFHM